MEMGVVVVDLVTAGTKFSPQMQGGFDTLVKPHAAIVRRLERTAVNQLLTILRIHSGREDEGTVFRFVRWGLPVSGSADGVTYITRYSRKSHRAQIRYPRLFDLAGNHPLRRMAPFALAGDLYVPPP